MRTSNPSMNGVPVIDLRSEDVEGSWGGAFSRYGFATVENHGVSDKDVTRLYDLSKEFFNQPSQVKMEASESSGYGAGGFVPMGVEAVDKTDENTPPDYVESLEFVFNKRNEMLNSGVGVSTELLESVQKYAECVSDLLVRICDLSEKTLGMPKGFYSKHGYGDKAGLKIRLAYYPKQEIAAVPGQLRYGAHTDYSGFTVLKQDGVSGLEVLDSGEWVGIQAKENCFVVNAGDLIERWSNGVWKSNVHRVVNTEGSEKQDRLSIVVFTFPEDDAIVTPFTKGSEEVKYEPVGAGEWMKRRIDFSNL